MNWKNLKNYKCPECGGSLVRDIDTLHHCANPNCDFAIGDSRYDEILKKKPSINHQGEEERLSELNNL